ncbi:MAG: glycosyltransferase family 2 protein [Lachnospiraceae bacterium]|nr:glycosyltransferase family 2 protein [Lachnospiraceae bacterium]
MRKISVIVPCYNVEPYLNRLFDSLEAQTFGIDNLEIICLDDKSTDNTLKKLEDWEKNHSDNVCIVALPDNGRQGRARNIGLQYASCEWIAFIDADDWIEKDYFQLLYERAKQGIYDVVACDMGRDTSTELVYFENRASKLQGGEWKVEGEAERKDFYHTQAMKYIAYCKLIRRKLLVEHEISFTEGLTYEDTYWGPLLNMYAGCVYTIPMKLYHYFVNTESTVLRRDSDHHLDLLTNQELLWQEYIRRGFMEKYKEEIEFEYVYSCALAFWKIIVFRYEQPSYSKYRLLCANVQVHIPEIESNKYIRNGELTEFYYLMLKSLLYPLSKEEFEVYVKQIKKIGL